MSKGSGAILKASGHINQQQQTTGNPRVSYSTSSTFTTTTTTTALYIAAFAKVDMILASSTPPTSSSSTVLAWLQKELALYVDLHLMSIPVDLTEAMDWLAKPLVCLAHRYFPDQFLNLSQQLQNHATTHKKALKVFEDRLHVVYNDDEDISSYLTSIQKGLVLTDDATLRGLHIRDNQSTTTSDFDLTLGISLTQLWQQWTELAKQESLSSTTTTTTTTASTRSSPSPPRIEPMQSRECWEDIEASLQQMQPQYQSFQQAIINNTDIPPDLAVRISAIDATHAALSAQMQRPTIEFATTVAYIRNELEFIQAKMLKTTTTDAGIHDLEVRSTKVGTLIDHLVRYDMDDGQHQHYQALLHKYQLIVSWVDDVRVWFVEAERIRGWIEQRIQLLEAKQSLNALEEVEYDYTPEQIDQWNKEHDLLQKEVEAFDAQDMTRLRAHVKQLTSTHKDLSPADTTTIEITFTTLTTLDRLMHLLRRHAYELQMLTLRMAWEQSYHVTVAWVRSVAEQVKQFVHDKARWRANDDHVQQQRQQQDKNSIISTLIQFEQQSAHFDQGQFTSTVNLYQDMDDACHIELPSHLESRQVAIEEGFEELTHRISFARQVVEQYLVVTDFLAKADQLKNEGETLRQEIVSADVSAVSTTELSEKVMLFQENTVRLVTGVAARVPYPEATHPSDQQGNDDANEMIRMVIGSRKSALVLFGEALDQSLSALRRALQLQKRAKQLQDEMARLGGWVDERLKAMSRSKVDVFVAGKCALDDTDLARLIKERDGQVAKLKGIKENEYKKLQENIAAVQQSSVSQHNVISTQVSALQDGMGTLGDQLDVLEEALKLHSSRLAILSRRISWETQHAMASVWISNHIFAVWDFVSRKAQWRVSTMMDLGEEEKETHQIGGHWRSQVQLECDDLVSKIQAFYTEQLKPVKDVYNELLSDFGKQVYNDKSINLLLMYVARVESSQSAEATTAIEYVQRRQDTLNQSYQNINDLIHYAQQVLEQHEVLTDFTRQVGELQTKGQQIKIDIQQAMGTVMHMGNNHHFKEAVQAYSQAVMHLWVQTGSQLPYPVCPEDARTTRPSTNDDEISTEVATAVYKAYTDLQALSNTLSDMVQRLDVGLMYRVQLDQWCLQVQHTTTNITDMTTTITSYSFDLTTGTMTQHSNVVDQGKQLEHELQIQCHHCYKDVNHIKQQLSEIQDAMATDDCDMLDLSITEKPLALLEESCHALNQSMLDFTRHLQVCEDRAQWHGMWLHQSQTLHGLQEAMLEWMNQKAWWISTFDGEGGSNDTLLTLTKQLRVCHLVLQDCIADQDGLKSSYNALADSFKAATGTALEDTQQNNVLHLSTKLQETMTMQLDDIQQIQERHDWASHVDEELKACANQELATETFIQLYARWSPSTSANHENLADKVDKLHQATAGHILAMDTLLNQVIQQQTEPIFRRKAHLQSTKHSLEQQDLFLDKVMEQQKALCAILHEINQVESLAESKKSVLLSLAQPSSHDVQEYKQRVDQVHALIDKTMVYPVRHYRDHNPRAREADASHNAGLQDMLKARQSRLIELGSTLESIIKSKERLSRRKAAEASYFAEAHVVDEWIDAKHRALSEEKESLKLAVAHINGLQSAINNYTTSVHGLQVAANKCIAVIQQQQGDDDVDDTAQSVQRIHDKQAYIDIKWRQLEDTIAKVQHQRQQELQHQEFMSLLHAFNTQCDKLQEALQQDMDQITESVCTQWQDELQALNTKLSELKLQAQRPDDVTDAAAHYDGLKEQVQQRSTEANHYRLKQEYAEGAAALESLMISAQEAFSVLQQKPTTMQGDAEQDKALVEEINADYASCCQILDQEKYDEQRSFYRFLQLNKVHDLHAIDDRKSHLEQQWKHIQQALASYQQQNIKSLIQWQELHSKLNDIKDEALAGVLDRLDHFQLSDAVSVPTWLDQDASLLALLRHRANACLDIAASLTQADDDKNMAQFRKRYDDLMQQMDAATLLLSEKRNLAQQHVDVIECEQLVASFCHQLAEEVEAIQTERVSDTTMPDATSLESLYKQVSTFYMTRETTQQAFKHQLMSIESRIDTVSKKYNVDTSQLLEELNTAMSDLNTQLADTAQVNDVVRRVLGHSKSADNIKLWLENCQAAIAELEEHQHESTALDLAGLTQKMSDFEKVMQSFLDLSQAVESVPCHQAIVHHMVDAIVKPTTADIQDQWQKTQADLKAVETEIEKTTRGVGVARKMKHLMALVGETRDYLDRTRLHDYDAQTEEGLSDEEDDDKTQVATDDEKKEGNEDTDPTTTSVGKKTAAPLSTTLPRQGEIQDIEKHLKATESEMLPQIEQELEELDRLMKEFNADVTFTRQHAELKASVHSLQEMFATKYSTLNKCMAIGVFLSTADDIEILQSSLEEAVSQSAPHHSLIGTLSRTDLQAKLIELDARFKYYERKIVPSLTLAQEQAKAVAELTAKGGEAVQAQLQDMDRKWVSIKKQFKTRKIELSRTIDTSQDSKDQHARIRKSSLPTRKASSLLRDRADVARQRLSPTASSTSSSSSSSRTTSTTRLPSRYLTPPPPHQPSKSATHLKSKSTHKVTKPPLNSYVADPDNDLDMEIGRIVNETPYRVKVKMVPGEVGRYWFGNLNPKLAYCRVLKSKMVMVRVGGGWTELSQFLRDHALLEGDFIPRHQKKKTTDAVIPEEDEPKSPTIQEGFIETHRQHPPPSMHRSGVVTGSPSHSASTTTSGYKDGDKFIAVDSHGNQLQVQMRKAPNNFIHTSSSSSTTNTSGSSLSNHSSHHLNDYTKRRIARRKEKKPVASTATVPSLSQSSSSK
ncbi:Glutamine synthetase [Mucor velutinosus]|uniref:Glutamine synthetase n=1 Tax=Mucor velutinosus TaxID=708070 RepID=A0AAN7DA84_9FUNG|nr:Glutamine synthetase [Mucor velutinosus]